MTDRRTTDLATELSARLHAVDGVVQVFPRHPVVMAIRAVTDTPPAVVEVELDAGGALLAVAARVGVARSAPAAEVLDRILEVLPTGPGDRPLRVDIEIAYIA